MPDEVEYDIQDGKLVISGLNDLILLGLANRDTRKLYALAFAMGLLLSFVPVFPHEVGADDESEETYEPDSDKDDEQDTRVGGMYG